MEYNEVRAEAERLYTELAPGQKQENEAVSLVLLNNFTLSVLSRFDEKCGEGAFPSAALAAALLTQAAVLEITEGDVKKLRVGNFSLENGASRPAALRRSADALLSPFCGAAGGYFAAVKV